MDLSTSVGPLRLANPITTAAGTSGHGAELEAFFPLRSLGAVVVKSLAAEPWAGNPAPRLHPLVGGMLNSVGLEGPGIEQWLEHSLPELEAVGAQVIVSIWGRSVDEFARVAAMLAGASAAVVAVEVNVSCPNLEDRSRMFAHSICATAEVLAATACCNRPRFAKLSPNTAELVEIAGAALEAGAAGLSLVNTALGMAIGLETRRPLLGGGGGGVSGGCLHPVAVRAVYECRAAFPEAGIFGVGGVASALDAVELLLAGADAVQVGTATLADPRAAAKILTGLRAWCAAHSVAAVSDLVGGAHRPL